MKRKKPLRSDPEKTREWQRRSRRNNSLKRSRLDRKTRLNPVNAKRRRKEFRRAYGSEARVKWVKAQPCIICGSTPSDNAHIEGGGAGRKADADKVVPLCHSHHRTAPDSYHALGGKDAFEREHSIDLEAVCERIGDEWDALTPEEQEAWG